MLIINVVVVIILYSVEATVYNSQNATKIFQFYKDKYHKVYIDATLETRGFENFLRNLNKVEALNENSAGNDTFFVLNKYADIDQENFEEHHALNLQPYDKSILHRELKVPRKELRNRIETQQKPEVKSVEHIDLYDLDDADNLYKQYMKKFNKKNFTKPYDWTVHYYRFLKTLVELNEGHYKGSKKRLDENADVIERPYDYTY